ncbi:MAG: hypothetical protein SLAVMIC_00454 [uncultured marine phage]|uniref:Uncharacterized protein n=1 Tax=uncultured marine phage TaxID=707152 RepID=A0A8D9C8Y9_9VIRU|nr:MAG: hypothetical protein SLAVMIC_00454 [uncultured marine phage]
MKWIRSYKLYKESKSSGNSSKVVFELCVAMLLINPEFLDKILDQGQKARYTENSLVFVNDLRNLVFGNNRLRVGEFQNDRFVESDELSKVNQYFADLTDGFDIEKDWNKLVKARNTARDIKDKLLLDSKLEESDIEFVYWVTPNKERGDREDLIIETHDGIQHGIVLNSKLSLSKTQSFNTFAEVLLGEENLEKLFNEEYISRWDKLTQEWIRIIYENAKKNIQLHIEKFIDPDRIYSMTWEDYFKSKHTDSRYKFLGEHIKEFDKNILKLSDLMSEIYKNPEVSFDNPDNVFKEWNEKKIFILNSKILEHLFSESFSELSDEEVKVERGDDNYIAATGDMKERIMKVFLGLLKVEEREVNYFGSDYHKVPSRQYFRNNFDNFRIKYDYHVELTPSEDEEMNDSQFRVILELNDKTLINMTLFTGWTGGEMSGKLSTKIKLEIPDDYNSIIVNSSETELPTEGDEDFIEGEEVDDFEDFNSDQPEVDVNDEDDSDEDLIDVELADEDIEDEDLDSEE